MAENNNQPDNVVEEVLPELANNAAPMGNGLVIRQGGQNARQLLQGAAPKAAAPKAAKGKGPKPQAPILAPAKAKAPKAPAKAVAKVAPAPAKQAPEVPVVGAPAVVQVHHPPAPPEVKHKKYRSFLEASNAWAPIAEANSPLGKYVTSIGVTPRQPEAGHADTNQHPAQAAERAVATVRALGTLYAHGKRRVVGCYGSPRDEKLVDFCNNQSDTKINDRMTYVRYSPIVTPKDTSRQPTNIPFAEAASQADNLFLVDIYEASIGKMGPLTPSSLASMLEYTLDPFGPLKITWVGRKFYGSAGLVAGEAGWYRRGDKIVYRSSIAEPQEYVHDPLDWLWKTSSANVHVHGQPAVLSWYLAKVVGTFYILNFNLTLGILDCNQEVELFEYDDQLVSVDCPTSSPFVSWLCPLVSYTPSFARKLLPIYEKQPLYLPVYLAAREAAQSRRYNQVNFTRVSNAILAAIQQSEAKLFYGLFPRFKPRKNFNALVWGIFLDDVNERHISTKTAMACESETMAEINDLQSSIGAPPSSVVSSKISILLKIAGVIVLGVGIWKFRGRRPTQPRQPNSLACTATLDVPYPLSCFLPNPVFFQAGLHPVHQVALATVIESVAFPIYEECVKRLHRNLVGIVLPQWLDFANLLPLYEFFSSVRTMMSENPDISPKAIFLMRLAPLVMHYFANQQSNTGRAIVLHMLWNAIGSKLWTWLICEMFRFKVSTTTIGNSAGTFNPARMFKYFASLGIVVLLWHLIAGFTAKAPSKVYEKWKHLYFVEPWDTRFIYETEQSFVENIDDWRVPEQVSALPLNEGMVQALYCPETRPSEPDHFFKITGALPERSHERPPTYYYHLLPTCAPGFVPKVCDENMAIAVAYRLLCPAIMPPEEQKEAWLKAFKQVESELRSFFPLNPPSLNVPWDSLVDKWVEHFSSAAKRRDYKKVVVRLKTQTLDFSPPETTELFVKHDEMLMQQDAATGCYQLKPRIIANVNRDFQAMIGPYVHALQKRMSHEFSVDRPARIVVDFIKGRAPPTYFSIVTGGGKSDMELSAWMTNVLNRFYVPRDAFGFCIIASGDDSVVAECRPDGSIVFYEGDARKFDQSESVGPLRVEATMLTWLGISPRTTNQLYQMAQATYVVKPHRSDGDQGLFKIGRKERPIRDTGGPNTYLGNTTIMFTAWYIVLRRIQRYRWNDYQKDPVATILDLFGELGFDMKMQRILEADQVTFLKGMWYCCDHDYNWGPLPSRILKVGKSLLDPRTIYESTSKYDAAECFLTDVANSYRVFLQVPILRAFVKRFRRSLDRTSAEARISQYHTQASTELREVKISDQAIDAVCQRYNITRDDLRRVERMIKTCQPLQFLHDPVFLALARVDYA